MNELESIQQAYLDSYDRGVFVRDRKEWMIRLPGVWNTGDPRIVPTFEYIPPDHSIVRYLDTTLAPCPFCNGESGLRYIDDAFYVRCWICGAQGPANIDFYRAVQLWHDRQ